MGLARRVVGARTGGLPSGRSRPAGLLRGARPADVGAYATEHLLDDVLAIANAMDMETFDLVGHDWGGMLAWIVASRHPGRVRTLTVVSTPHPLALQEALRGADPRQAAYGASMDAYRAPAVPERLLLGADGGGGGLATLLAETGLDDEDARMYVTALTEPGALTAALNWYRAMDGTALQGLNPVCVPTLYVWLPETGPSAGLPHRTPASACRGPTPLRSSTTCRTGSPRWRRWSCRAPGPPSAHRRTESPPPEVSPRSVRWDPGGTRQNVTPARMAP